MEVPDTVSVLVVLAGERISSRAINVQRLLLDVSDRVSHGAFPKDDAEEGGGGAHQVRRRAGGGGGALPAIASLGAVEAAIVDEGAAGKLVRDLRTAAVSSCCAVLKFHDLSESDANDLCAFLWRFRDEFEFSVSCNFCMRNVRLALATTLSRLSCGIRSISSHAPPRAHLFFNVVMHTLSESVVVLDCEGHARATWEATRRLVAEQSPTQSCPEFRVAFVCEKDSLLLASLVSDFAQKSTHSELGERLEDMIARGLDFHESKLGIEHSRGEGLRHPTKAWCVVLSWNSTVHWAARAVLDDYLQSHGLSVDDTFEHVTKSTSEETTTVVGILARLLLMFGE